MEIIISSVTIEYRGKRITGYINRKNLTGYIREGSNHVDLTWPCTVMMSGSYVKLLYHRYILKDNKYKNK